MTGCKEVKTKKYRSRPGPPYHASDCKGQTKKGNDGKSYVSKADAKGIYKWVPASGGTKTRKLKGKAYDIHDNGSVPFKVQLQGKTAVLYKVDYNEETETQSVGKQLLKQPFQKIWLGGNDQNLPMYEPKSAHDKGNSILLDLGKGKLMWIGWKVYTFEVEKGDEIQNFYSPIGNNDVPYPYAVGNTHTYLMIEDVSVANELLTKGQDPYEHYYGFTDKPSIKKKAKPLRNQKVVIKRQM